LAHHAWRWNHDDPDNTYGIAECWSDVLAWELRAGRPKILVVIGKADEWASRPPRGCGIGGAASTPDGGLVVRLRRVATGCRASARPRCTRSGSLSTTTSSGRSLTR
jgi:hypothetical protein